MIIVVFIAIIEVQIHHIVVNHHEIPPIISSHLVISSNFILSLLFIIHVFFDSELIDWLVTNT